MTITLHTLLQHRLRFTLILGFILLLFPFLVKAGNYTTIANGKWSNSAIWSGGVVPGASDTATIAYTDTLDASESIKNITINSSKSLTVSGTNTLTVNGNFTNNGTFTASSGTVIFTGSANQTISGSGAITFYNLTGNPSAVTDTIFLGKAITINNNFTISQGAFDCKTYQVTGNTSGIISMASGTVLLLGLPSSTTNVLFPSSYTNAHISLNSNSTVIYQADNTSTGQTVSVAPYYGNLALSNGASGTTYGTVLYITGNMTIGSGVSFKTNANIDTIKGNLIINSGGTYTLEGTNLYFQGNLVNNGTFNGTVGTCDFDGSTNQVISGPINNPTNTFFNALIFTPKYSTDTTFIEANISTTTGITNHGVMIVPAAYNDSIIYDAGITNVGTCIAYNGVSYFKTGYLTSAVAGNPSIFHKITVNQNFCFYCNTIVTSDFTRIGGTLSYYGTDTLFLAGNYINNTTASTSMDAIYMNGSHNQTIGGTVSPFLGILIINQAASTDTVKLGDSITCYGIILKRGVLDVTPANYSITNGRGVTNNSTFLTRSGTLYFINAYTYSIGGSSTYSFNNVVCNGSGTLDLASNQTVKGNFRINSGTFDVTTSNYKLTVGGNFTNNGTFTPRSGTVTLNGSANQTISGTGTLTFYNLIGKQASATDSIFLGKAITVNNNLADSAGVFDCQNYQVTGNATGTLTLAANTGLVLGLPSSTTNISFPTSFTTAHTTLNAASTVTYQANTAQTISTTPTYGNLVLASGTSATRKTPATTTLAVAGNLNINSNAVLPVTTGTVNLTGNLCNADSLIFSTGALNIGGTFTNNGAFTYGTGITTFTNNANQQVNGSVTPEFYNLTLNTPSATDTLFLNNPVTVSNTLTTTQGILDCKGNQLTNSATPPISISPGTVTICNGSSTMLTASGYSTYIWSPRISLSSSTGGSVTATPSVTTTYSVVGSTGNKYLCALSTGGSGAVTVNTTPTVSVTPSSATICSGNSDTLRASGATTYTWSPGTGLSVTTGATVVASPTVTTTYTVTGMNGYGCSNSKPISITVNPTPTVTISYSADTICSGTRDTLVAAGASSYLWNTTATTSSIIVSPLVNNLYSVTGTSTYGCYSSASKLIVVKKSPTVSISTANNFICPSNSSILYATGATTYLWNNSSTSNSITVSPTSSTVYSVVGTTINGCSNTAHDSLTVGNCHWKTNPFDNALFIQNNGQYNSVPVIGSNILYASQFGSMSIFFTKTGLTYQYITYTGSPDPDGSAYATTPQNSADTQYVNMEWVGSSSSVSVVPSNLQSYYYTYPTGYTTTTTTNVYKTLTYQNLYSGIDAVFTLYVF